MNACVSKIDSNNDPVAVAEESMIIGSFMNLYNLYRKSPSLPKDCTPIQFMNFVQDLTHTSLANQPLPSPPLPPVVVWNSSVLTQPTETYKQQPFLDLVENVNLTSSSNDNNGQIVISEIFENPHLQIPTDNEDYLNEVVFDINELYNDEEMLYESII